MNKQELIDKWQDEWEEWIKSLHTSGMIIAGTIERFIKDLRKLDD